MVAVVMLLATLIKVPLSLPTKSHDPPSRVRGSLCSAEHG